MDGGFSRTKLKFRPDSGVGMVASVREAFPDMPLHIDCNSGFTLDDMDLFELVEATPRLAELFDEFQRKFPEVDWSQRHLQPPPTGTLDLEEVRKSLYFFA